MLPSLAPGPGVAPSIRLSHGSSLRRRRLRQRGVSLVELAVVVSITGILATMATYSVRERMFEAHSVEAVAMLGNIRSGLLAKSDDLTGNSATTLRIGGRVGGFGGPLGLPGVLGDIDGDGNKGHGNNEGKCDPDNPGAKGGADCGGGGDGSSGSGSSGSGDSSGSGTSSGTGSSGSGSGSSGGGSGATVVGASSLCGSATPVPASLEAVKGSVYQSRPGDWRNGDGDHGWGCLSVSRSAAQRFQYGYDVGSSAVPAGNAPAGADTTFAAWARGDLDGDGRTSWFVLNGAALGGHVVMAPALTIIDQGE